MTIAIGVLCSSVGVVIAADTRIIMGDGSKKTGSKIEYESGSSGAYVIANASNDGNAATTLVRRMLATLKSQSFTSFSEIEQTIISEMTVWSAPHYTLPDVELIVAATLNHDPEKVRLYYCQPPNTILRHTLDEPYIGAGCCARVTDPLWKMLFFSSIHTPRTALMKISYLMYRAKQDDSRCGDRTLAVVLVPGEEPEPINPLDLEAAEKLGGSLDFLFRGTSAAIIGQTDESSKEFCSKFGDMIFQVGNNLRNIKFHKVRGGDTIN